LVETAVHTIEGGGVPGERHKEAESKSSNAGFSFAKPAALSNRNKPPPFVLYFQRSCGIVEAPPIHFQGVLSNLEYKKHKQCSNTKQPQEEAISKMHSWSFTGI